MRFIIIILCLLSEKYMTHQFFTFRRKWSDLYGYAIDTYIPSKVLNASPIMRYAIYLGSLTLLCIILSMIGHQGLGLILNFIFELSVFYICLGEHNLFFVNANEKKLLSDNEFILAMNQEFYAVILWFFILGPFGALLYRVTVYFNQKKSPLMILVKLKAFLDWIPVRMSSLLLLLVGQFQPGFSVLVNNMNSNPLENDQLLIRIARLAMNAEKDEALEMMKLQNLFNHSCLLMIFILAIFVIGTII
jgi:AmpE protein